MRILFYGRLAEAIAPELEWDTPASLSVAELRRQIANEYPDIAGTLMGGRAVACVSGSITQDNHVMGASDCVEFLSPVSGG